jgi:DNA-binding transcriptional ArsR family regulator
MTKINDVNEPMQESVEIMELIEKVKSGEVEGKNLPRETRVICVAYLVAEGFSSSELATLFGVDSRTIRRDIEWLRDAHVIELDAIHRREIRELVTGRLQASLKLISDLQEGSAKTLKEQLKCEDTSWRIMKIGFAILNSLYSSGRRDKDLGLGSLGE